MNNSRRYGLVIAALLIADVTSVHAQVTLQMGKSGSDVVLSWSGGSGTYDVIRSTFFRMSAATEFLQTGVSAAGFTDTNALVPNHNPPLYCYVIADVAAKPALNIEEPCDSPSGGPPCTEPTTARIATVSGTTNSGRPVYVNDSEATTPGPGEFETIGLNLFLGPNLVVASTRNAAGDWAIDSIIIDRHNGNQSPVITITTPANGVTIYDPTPFIQIDYADPDGLLDSGDVTIFLDGQDLTQSFARTATQATYQVAGALTAGAHFIYATIRDATPSFAGASAVSQFTLSDPVITSFSPAAEGRIGDAITISGAGFDPTLANNMVTFNGEPAEVAAASPTSLTVVVPPSAETGLVVVTVDSRSSRGKPFRVFLATNFLSIGSVAVNPTVSNHVFFTDRSTNDQLYEILPDGTVQARCALGDPIGLPVDSSGNLYFGVGTPGSMTALVVRYLPASTTCPNHAETKLPGENTANVQGVGLSEVGGLNIYTVDSENGRIKRVNPSNVASLITSGQIFTNPAGLATNSTGSTLFFTSGNNIRSIPIPAGGTVTAVKTFAGGPKGLVTTADNKLIVARSTANTISWLDPSSTSNPFWDLAAGLSAPQMVALGDPGGTPFLVVAENTRVFRAPRPSLLLSDTANQALPAKVVADFAPDTADCVGSNILTLKVRFSPSTLIPDTTPRQTVTWTVIDPDDPSDDPDIDDNGTEGDDNLTPLGDYPQWAQVVGFPLSGSLIAPSVQTEITGGESRVSFKLSCKAGDNYRFVAQVAVPVYGALSETSDTLTVWRRLHVESDSMGAGGPFDSDDAALDDVPDPVLSFLTNAFLPAYVEVVLPPDTGEDTPDVRFQNNVDTTAPGSQGAANLSAQGRLGRATVSSAGHWVAYLQGGYEAALDRDNDPDGGTVALGTSNGPNGAHGFVWTETLRDYSAQLDRDTAFFNAITALHEIGHQFSLGEGEGCVMNPPPLTLPVFCGPQILTIRDTDVPSNIDSQ